MTCCIQEKKERKKDEVKPSSNPVKKEKKEGHK